MMHRTILLTGRPGVGKTTVIRRIVAEIDTPASGFFTAEIRQGGNRHGFEIITLADERAILAHVDYDTRHRIGRYGVDISTLDNVGVAAIGAGIRRGELVVIDEIGPMEIISSWFREVLLEALDSEVQVLGTIYDRSNPFTDRIKRRSDVHILTVTQDNRNRLAEQILRQLGSGRS